MTIDIREGQLEAASAVAAIDAEAQLAPIAAPRAKKSWREQRWERRRRRLWFEEALAWVLVPAIVVGCYYVVNATLAALGTSPAAIMDGISMVTSLL